jgi:4-hydroxy-tetrahydrodipicolinate synthase
MTIDWSGIFHILATPFTDDAALDLDGVPRLVESVLATGVRGITILGIAGEAHRLNDEERRRMVEAVVKEARGRVPVVVGVSASGTHLAAGFAAMARAHGADVPLIRYESQPGAVPGTSMAIRKEILRRRGWIASARVRPAAASLDPATLEELSELLSVVAAR